MKYKKLNEVLIEWNKASEEDSDNRLLNQKDINDSLSYEPNVIDFTGIYTTRLFDPEEWYRWDKDHVMLNNPTKQIRGIQLIKSLIKSGDYFGFSYAVSHESGSLIPDNIEIFINNKLIHLDKEGEDYRRLIKTGRLSWNTISKKILTLEKLNKKRIEIRCKIKYSIPLTGYVSLFANTDLIELKKLKNTKNIHTFRNLFSGSKLEKVCWFDTSSSEDIEYMFNNTKIKTIPENFNFKNVTDCNGLFNECTQLEGPLPKLDMPLVDRFTTTIFKNVNFGWWKKYNQGWK